MPQLKNALSCSVMDITRVSLYHRSLNIAAIYPLMIAGVKPFLLPHSYHRYFARPSASHDARTKCLLLPGEGSAPSGMFFAIDLKMLLLPPRAQENNKTRFF